MSNTDKKDVCLNMACSPAYTTFSTFDVGNVFSNGLINPELTNKYISLHWWKQYMVISLLHYEQTICLIYNSTYLKVSRTVGPKLQHYTPTLLLAAIEKGLFSVQLSAWKFNIQIYNCDSNWSAVNVRLDGAGWRWRCSCLGRQLGRRQRRRRFLKSAEVMTNVAL